MQKCPGQDTRYWGPDDVAEVTCGDCGEVLEFFTTEGSRRCPECGGRVVNPAVSMGCAQWCEFAEECLGFDPDSVDADDSPEQSLADALTEEVQRRFGDDRPRINHALQVLDHARSIMREEGGEPRVVVAAALLHDIGIPEAERRHGSAAPKYQESEGPPVAREILEELDWEDATVDHVCNIVAHHHSGPEKQTIEFRVVWDADRLVNFADEFGDRDTESKQEAIERIFTTGTGRRKARERFLCDSGEAQGGH